eukprot:TRINITY_DN11596_c0_g1_i1.p1 TRINITY_DN11596_c0_g1~~TRINITY_DN11596_c0_g1_i1.p1  ORF type:complete len:255 (+),score=57.80 TRINITY_DN11596_c0_g1_i1:46-765(+)
MNFLVAVDNSNYSYWAFNKMIALAQPEDMLYIVHVKEIEYNLWSQVFGFGLEEYASALQIIQERSTVAILRYYAKLLRQTGHKNYSLVSIVGKPGPSVVGIATNKNVDTIFIGSRGLNKIKAFLLGSTSKYVVDHAPCDVQVVKAEYGPPEESEVSRFEVIQAEEAERNRRINEEKSLEVEHDMSKETAKRLEEFERMRRMVEDDYRGVGSHISKYSFLDEVEDIRRDHEVETYELDQD